MCIVLLLALCVWKVLVESFNVFDGKACVLQDWQDAARARVVVVAKHFGNAPRARNFLFLRHNLLGWRWAGCGVFVEAKQECIGRG